MCTSRFDTRRVAFVVGLALAMSACEIEPAEFRDSLVLSSVEFQLFSENVGVHPNDDILADPNNPFAKAGIGEETKFFVLESSSTPAAWYAWATLLATQPNGEHQYNTALLMEAIAATREGEERLQLEQIAIRGYQAVLDFFPGDVAFTDATLLERFRLATPAYFGILRLGGQVEGDWVVVVDQDGNQQVVEGSAEIRPETPPETDDEDEDEVEGEEGGS